MASNTALHHPLPPRPGWISGEQSSLQPQQQQSEGTSRSGQPYLKNDPEIKNEPSSIDEEHSTVVSQATDNTVNTLASEEENDDDSAAAAAEAVASAQPGHTGDRDMFHQQNPNDRSATARKESMTSDRLRHTRRAVQVARRMAEREHRTTRPSPRCRQHVYIDMSHPIGSGREWDCLPMPQRKETRKRVQRQKEQKEQTPS